MILQELTEATYSGMGEVIEVKYVIYDTKENAYIQTNYNNQAGFSRRGSIAQGDGVSWFRTEENARNFLNKLYKKIGKKRYKAGSTYTTYGNYRFQDKKITLTAKQAESKNRMLDKRLQALESLVVATVIVRA